MNTIRSCAAQCRFAPPCVDGTEALSVVSLAQRCVALPVLTSAIQRLHGAGLNSSIEPGAPPLPARRAKTRRVPSGDQRGDQSRLVLGAIHLMGVAESV